MEKDLSSNENVSSPYREKIFDIMQEKPTSSILKHKGKYLEAYGKGHSSSKYYHKTIQNDFNFSASDMMIAEGGHLKTLPAENIDESDLMASKSFQRHLKFSPIKEKSSDKKIRDTSFVPSDCQSRKKSSKANSNRKKVSKTKAFSNNKSSLKKSFSSQQIFGNPVTDRKANNPKNWEKSESDKKTFLMNTLKKMESVRKNLTKTFEDCDFVKQSNGIQKTNHNKSDFVNFSRENENSKHPISNRGDFSLLDSSSKQVQSCHSQQKNSRSKGLSRSKSRRKKFTHRGHSEFEGESPISRDILRQLLSSGQKPEKWIALEQGALVSIYFRVVKFKLIEIELHAHVELGSLSLSLAKGNLKCQSISEQYSTVKKNEIITLLCSVRGIELNDQISLFDLPKLMISLSTHRQQESDQSSVPQEVTLPYSWIILAQESPVNLPTKNKKPHQTSVQNAHENSQLQMLRSRIRTRTSLQNLNLRTGKKCNLLKVFSFVENLQIQLHTNKPQKQREGKKQSSLNKQHTNENRSETSTPKRYKYSFILDEKEFTVSVGIDYKKQKYSLEIEGKCEGVMKKMLLFLQTLK